MALEQKMLISAIISEYNPFHNGHKFLIDKIRELGTTHVVAIMSGNFVQRGDVAIANKRDRTKSALLNGVDLVIELPTPYAMSCAETFAKNAVFIANSLGCIDYLCFGSESGSIDDLSKAADISYSDNIQSEIRNQLLSGVSYPKAKVTAINQIYEDIDTELFSSPNNILAIEYIHALNKLNSSIKPITICRNINHDSDKIYKNIASASLIRKMMYNDNSDYNSFIPQSTWNIYHNLNLDGFFPSKLDYLDRVVLYKLRNCTHEYLHKIPDVSEGLENRILNCVNTANSINSLLDMIKTKRYTYVRIRRIILSCLLGLTRELQSSAPPYLRVLGFNDRGIQIMNKIKHLSSLPIVIRASDIYNLDKSAQTLYSFESRCTDIYGLSSKHISTCGLEYTDFPIKI